MIDFDRWRRKYDRLTYAEHVDFYRHVAEVYPDQRHYNAPAVKDFLTGVSGHVLELGGWQGELAAEVLPDFPGIESWLNVEIAPQAISRNTCTDPRYSVIVPDAFLWDAGLELGKYRTLIASHVLEHLKVRHVQKLLWTLPQVERLYVDAPLPDKPSLWGGGESSHIIEVGWNGLHDLIESFGFQRVGSAEGKWGPAFWYLRTGPGHPS